MHWYWLEWKPQSMTRHLPNFKYLRSENRCINDEDVIAQAVKPGVKYMATKSNFSMVRESLDNILRTLFQNAQSNIQ